MSTFLDMQNHVIGTRFNAAQLPDVKRWLQRAYADVWNQDEWIFKRVQPVTLAVASGNATPTLATDVDEVLEVYDEFGQELVWLAPDEFDEFQQLIAGSGNAHPDVWTFVNRKLYLSPTPDQAYAFTYAYRRRLSCLNGSGAIVLGNLSADTDLPLWDAEFHDVLEYAAISTGLVLENDPTWEPVDALRQGVLAAMREALTVKYQAGRQYGRVVSRL